MKKVVFKHPHRQKHFEFFKAMSDPHFGITANVDITEFLALVRKRADLRFTPAMVYLIARVAHEVPNFKWRIHGDEVVEHESVRPSFAVPTETGAFSFCTVNYHEDPMTFHRAAEAMMEEMTRNPSFEDEPGKDDYLYLSTIPWVSYTSIQHAMHNEPSDSVPRVVWGKYFKQGDQVLMPLSVHAHHAVVDGSDLGAYFQKMQVLLKKSEEIFS